MNFGRDTSQLIILGLKANAWVKVRREGKGFWVGGEECTKSGSERGCSDFKDLKVVQSGWVGLGGETGSGTGKVAEVGGGQIGES